MKKILVSGLAGIVLGQTAHADGFFEELLLNVLEHPDIERETFRTIVDILPSDEPIFSKLKTREGRLEMARYAIRLDQTNEKSYLIPETGCDYDDLDKNPNARCFNCRQFTLQTKFNLRGGLQVNLASQDPMYQITELDKKYQIPETYRVSYVGELPNDEMTLENKGVFEHAVNAIYLGDTSIPFAQRIDPQDWLIFEPQTDRSFYKLKVSYRADGTSGFATIISNDVEQSPLDTYSRLPTGYNNSLGDDALQFYYGPYEKYPDYVGTGFEKALLIEVLSPQGDLTSYVEGEELTVKGSDEILGLLEQIGLN